MANTLMRRPLRSSLWEPTEVFGDMDRMLAGFFRPISGTGNDVWTPALDVRETADEFIIDAELPGLTKKDVDITFEDGVLTLSGERRMEEQTEDKGYRRVERRYGSFSRALTLPREIDADNVTAAFQDGLLTVRVPKKETAKPRSIKIN